MLSSACLMSMAARTLVLAIATLVAAAGCAAGSPPPCGPSDPCAASERCVVGVCRPAREAVAPERSRRVVLLARDVAVLSPSESVDTAGAVTPFGARIADEVIVLMQFDGQLGSKAEVASAFVVLDPETTSPGPTQPIRLEAAEVLEAWEAGEPSWGRAPRLGPTIGTAIVPKARRAPVRIDVTKAIARTRGTGFGLALRASGSDAYGARLITAAGDSSGPRLELYLK